jgi:hypothetical protein
LRLARRIADQLVRFGDDDLLQLVRDWDTARGFLRVQLYSDAQADLPDMIAERVGEGLHRALVIDGGDRIVSAIARATVDWPGTRTDWLAAAVENLSDVETDEESRWEGRYTRIEGNSYSSAKVLHTLPSIEAPYGIALGVPTRSVSVLHLVESRAAWREAEPRMARACREAFAELEGPVSPHLYGFLAGNVCRIAELLASLPG